MIAQNLSHLQFGKVPYAMIASGAMQFLNRNDLAVYLVLAAHSDGRTWEARPSVNRIAFLAGVHVRSVPRIMRRLEEYGLIEIQRRGGRGICNVYTLVRDPERLKNAPSRVSMSPGSDDVPAVYFGGTTQKPDTKDGMFTTLRFHDNRTSKTGQTLQKTLPGSNQKHDNKDVTQTEDQNENTMNRRNGASAKRSDGHGPLPHIEDADLTDNDRLFRLFQVCVERGILVDSENDRLQLAAAAERAIRVGENPCRLFASIVNDRVWHFASQDDENRAQQRIKSYEDRA